MNKQVVGTSGFMVITLITLIIVSCGKKETTNSEEYVAGGTTAAAGTAVDQVALGETLVKGSDCSTCHHKVNTLIGPAHETVAKKYEFTEANVKIIAEQIINGGSGKWGQVPMPAHVDVSQGDAEAMARYILSLDGEKEH